MILKNFFVYIDNSNWHVWGFSFSILCLYLFQEPVIFSGSLRQNLDPLLEYSETEVWAAVEKAHLKGFIENLTEGLDYECGEGGQALR